MIAQLAADAKQYLFLFGIVILKRKTGRYSNNASRAAGKCEKCRKKKTFMKRRSVDSAGLCCRHGSC